MKVLILSDLHLEFAPFEPVLDLEFDVVNLAGDIHSPAKRAVQWAAERFRGKPVVYLLGNHEYFDGRLDTTLAEVRREAEGSNVHLLDGDELVIDRVRFLGATLRTDFELAIETPEGPVSDAARAMKMATNLLNDYTLIRAADESTEPDTWRYKQGRKLQAADTLRIHQAQRAWLLERLSEPFAGPTVVVTHHAPHRLSPAWLKSPSTLRFGRSGLHSRPYRLERLCGLKFAPRRRQLGKRGGCSLRRWRRYPSTQSPDGVSGAAVVRP